MSSFILCTLDTKYTLQTVHNVHIEHISPGSFSQSEKSGQHQQRTEPENDLHI